MYPGRYVVHSVLSSDGEHIVSASTDRLHNIAGTYVGKDDPIAIVRTQKNFPATEEVAVHSMTLTMLQAILGVVIICLLCRSN